MIYVKDEDDADEEQAIINVKMTYRAKIAHCVPEQAIKPLFLVYNVSLQGLRKVT